MYINSFDLHPHYPNECLREPIPCLNGGSCFNTFESYVCECSEGFTGQNCEQLVEPECNICGQNGECKVLSLNDKMSFYCHCFDGFSGPFCEHDINECDLENICGGFQCMNSIGSFHCSCPEGYTGIYCEQDINECQDMNMCNGNGECVNVMGSYGCVCYDNTFDPNKNCAPVNEDWAFNYFGGYYATCFTVALSASILLNLYLWKIRIAIGKQGKYIWMINQ